MYIFCFTIYTAFLTINMEDEGVDRTVKDCWQNQLGQMAVFLPVLTFIIFDL